MDDVEEREIVSLNDADLDLEQLESRFELSIMLPSSGCWVHCCGIDVGCTN